MGLLSNDGGLIIPTRHGHGSVSDNDCVGWTRVDGSARRILPLYTFLTWARIPYWLFGHLKFGLEPEHTHTPHLIPIPHLASCVQTAIPHYTRSQHSIGLRGDVGYS